MAKVKISAWIAAAVVAVLVVWWWQGSGGASGGAVGGLGAGTVDRSALVRPDAATQGPAQASVELVEFFDPACGTCSQFYPMVKGLLAANPGRIRLVMRYAPFHRGSDKVVAVLEAARRQGKFWPTVEALLGSQSQWVVNHVAYVDRIWEPLKGVGLNMEQLAFDMTSPEVQRVITQDLRDANTLGVTQTPEYFVNGKPLPSFGWEPLQQLVTSELAATR